MDPHGEGGFFYRDRLRDRFVCYAVLYHHPSNKPIKQTVSLLRCIISSPIKQTDHANGLFVTLYYIISHHYFEYKYAYTHSDKGLQMEYLLACFWEGQEGSFMLWAFPETGQQVFHLQTFITM